MSIGGTRAQGVLAADDAIMVARGARFFTPTGKAEGADLRLIQLAEPVPGVIPMRIASPQESELWAKDRTLGVSGWGEVEDGTSGLELRVASATVLNTKLSRLEDDMNPGSMQITRVTRRGDSGGPVTTLGAGGLVQVGVIKRDNRSRTRVAAVRVGGTDEYKWLSERIKNEPQISSLLAREAAQVVGKPCADSSRKKYSRRDVLDGNGDTARKGLWVTTTQTMIRCSDGAAIPTANPLQRLLEKGLRSGEGGPRALLLGLPGMRVGGIRKVVGPAKYAYGPGLPWDGRYGVNPITGQTEQVKPIVRDGRQWTIPPNETVVWIVKLNRVGKDCEKGLPIDGLGACP